MTKSIKLFEKASRLESYHPLPYVNAGRTYQQLGQLSTARDHLKIAMTLDPSLAMTRVDYAQLLRQMNEIDQAVVTIEEALELARQVSEIRDVLTAKYVTSLQHTLKEEGFFTSLM